MEPAKIRVLGRVMDFPREGVEACLAEHAVNGGAGDAVGLRQLARLCPRSEGNEQHNHLRYVKKGD